jgi:hypothetical protein
VREEGGGTPCREEGTTAVRRRCLGTAYVQHAEPRGKLPCAADTYAHRRLVRVTVRRPRGVRVSIGLHSVGHRGKVVGQELGGVGRLLSRRCNESGG